jgi:hypothetical protein
MPPDEPLVPESSESPAAVDDQDLAVDDQDLAVEAALAEAATAGAARVEAATETTASGEPEVQPEAAVTNGVPRQEREPAGTRGRTR